MFRHPYLPPRRDLPSAEVLVPMDEQDRIIQFDAQVQAILDMLPDPFDKDPQ